MIKRRSKVALQLAHSLQDAGIHQLVEVAKLISFLVQELELAQQLLVLCRQRRGRRSQNLLDLFFEFLRLFLAVDIGIGFTQVSTGGPRPPRSRRPRMAQKIRAENIGFVAVRIERRRLEPAVAIERLRRLARQTLSLGGTPHHARVDGHFPPPPTGLPLLYVPAL